MSYFDDHNITREQIEQERANANPQQEFMDLINQLTEELLNPAKPVSKRALRSLPVIVAREEHTKLDPCPICQDQYEEDDHLVKLPCNHVFHKDCVFTWFEKENTCAMCRSELESDNPEHNAGKIDKEDQSNDVMHSMYM